MNKPNNQPLSRKLKLALQVFAEEIADGLETNDSNEFKISFNNDAIYNSEFGANGLDKAFRYLLKHKIINKNSCHIDPEHGSREETEGVAYITFSLKAAKFDYFISVNESLFYKFLDKIGKQEEYIKEDTGIYYVEYYDDIREVHLYKNGKSHGILSKTKFDSENDRVMSYLFQNSNRKISIEELQNACGEAVGNDRKIFNKTIHSIIYELGFKGDLSYFIIQ